MRRFSRNCVIGDLNSISASSLIFRGKDFTAEQADEQIRMSEEFRKVIEQIINLPGIVIEVVGNWIWVTGNTYPVPTDLKAAGLFFASKKLPGISGQMHSRLKGAKKHSTKSARNIVVKRSTQK